MRLSATAEELAEDRKDIVAHSSYLHKDFPNERQ